VVLPLADDKKAWIFHGDVFDVTMQHSKWLAKLGAIGYDALIVINMFANFISEKIFKRGKLSLSKKIKNSVKSAVKFINNFEKTAADIGISNKYDYVVCGHIHQPEMREIHNEHGSIMYLNSGDWIENLTALEYNEGKWVIYKYDESLMMTTNNSEEEDPELSNGQLFDSMLREFNMTHHL
jgi:UDP-2,3-diacylglucosamine pyrophosphatase LpxH